MRRYVVTHRAAIARPPATLTLRLRPAAVPGQRVHLHEIEFEPAPITTAEHLDEHGNSCRSIEPDQTKGLLSIVSTSVVGLNPSRAPSAFDRPWEHAVIARIAHSRQLDPLAHRVAGPVITQLPPHVPLRELIERDRPAAVARDLSAAGLAVRRTYGYSLDPAALAEGYAVYTPDFGWCAIDMTPMIIVAWSPLDVDLPIDAGADVVEIDVIRL